MVKTGIGQDSHRFVGTGQHKSLVLGGIVIDGCPGLDGNSDADVVLHAVTNAISGITGRNILGAISDEMCLKNGITDSREYLKRSLESLGEYRLTHISMTIEAFKPKLSSHLTAMRERIAGLCGLTAADVGITATSGEQLTSFGRGEGIQVFAVATAVDAGFLKHYRDKN